jgi:hypothetical protein
MEPLSASFKGEAKATMLAKLQLPERGVLVLGVFFVIVFGLSLWSFSVRPSSEARVCMGVALMALIVLGGFWFSLSRSTPDPQLSPTIVQSATTGVAVTTPVVKTPEQLLGLIREVVRPNKVPPRPYGYVDADKPPTDAGALHIYTPEEVEKDLLETRARIDDQEIALIRDLIEALRNGSVIEPGNQQVVVQDLGKATPDPVPPGPVEDTGS